MISAVTDGDPPETILESEVVALDGVSVTFDAATIELTDLLLTIPTTGIFTLDSPYGDYEQFRIESATIQDGAGFMTLFGFDAGGGNYTFAAGPLDINGFYSAFDLDFLVPDIINQAVPFTDDSFISGSININTGTLTLSGITLAVLPGGAFGEADNLEVKADITFVGMEAIPEPSTAVLVGLGLVGLASARRAKFLK